MHGGNTPPGVCDVIERSGELDIDRTLSAGPRPGSPPLLCIFQCPVDHKAIRPSIHTCGGLGQMSVDAARLC